MRYYDCHTHTQKLSPNTLSLYVLALNQPIVDLQPFCIGLHPWDCVETSLDLWIKTNEHKFQHPHCWATGEVGIDNIKVANLNNKYVYLNYFFSQALRLQKPIVLHLVKALQEFYDFLHRHPQYHNVPMIIHAYHDNNTLTENLLQYPIYFSLGPRELKRVCKNKYLKEHIFSRLLLETDDSGKDILEIYRLAESYFDKSSSDIQTRVQSNFEYLFPLSKSFFHQF